MGQNGALHPSRHLFGERRAPQSLTDLVQASIPSSPFARGCSVNFWVSWTPVCLGSKGKLGWGLILGLDYFLGRGYAALRNTPASWGILFCRIWEGRSNSPSLESSFAANNLKDLEQVSLFVKLSLNMKMIKFENTGE